MLSKCRSAPGTGRECPLATPDGRRYKPRLPAAPKPPDLVPDGKILTFPAACATIQTKGGAAMYPLEHKSVGFRFSSDLSLLTLKGAGSLDCGEAMAALVISGGSLALAEGYSLNEEAEIYNISDGESSAGHVIQAGTAESNPIPATSFTIQSEQSGDGTGSYSAEVKGTYQPGGSGAVVYSVDIAWTDMSSAPVKVPGTRRPTSIAEALRGPGRPATTPSP